MKSVRNLLLASGFIAVSAFPTYADVLHAYCAKSEAKGVRSDFYTVVYDTKVGVLMIDDGDDLVFDHPLKAYSVRNSFFVVDGITNYSSAFRMVFAIGPNPQTGKWGVSRMINIERLTRIVDWCTLRPAPE